MKKTNPNGEMTAAHVYVLIACCIMTWGVMGLPNAYGVFFTPMGEALNAGKAAVSLHVSLRALAMGLGSPIAAKLIQMRVKVKKTMPMGMAVYLVTSLLIPYARNVVEVDLLAVVAGFGYSLFSYMIIMILLGNWFRKNLGTFTGIAISFSGIGSAIASPIIEEMLSAYGYQTTYVIFTVLTVLMVLPVLFCAFAPEHIGLNPYTGGTEPESGAKAAEGNLDMPFKMFSVLSAVVFLMTLFVVGLTTLNAHLPSLATANGFAPATGALLVSASMIGNLTSKLALGVAIDRLGVIKSYLIVLCITVVGFLIILLTKNAAALLLAGGFLYGTVFSLSSLGLSILARYLYGNEQYNSVYSKMTLINSFGYALFTVVIGLLYDATGSYSAPVIMGIIMTLVCLIFTLWLRLKTAGAPKHG